MITISSFKCKFILGLSKIQDLAKISENIEKICKDLIKNCKIGRISRFFF